MQGHEIGPHILSLARHKAQDFWQAPQHPHLPGAAVSRARLGRSAQLLQKPQRPGRRRIHPIPAQPRQPHHIAGGHHPQHCIAILTPRLQRRHDGPHMLFHKQHGGKHDIGPANVCLAALQQGIIAAPIGCGMKPDRNARMRFRQLCLRPLRSTRQVIVQRYNHNAEWHLVFTGRTELGISAHDEPLHRKAFPA